MNIGFLWPFHIHLLPLTLLVTVSDFPLPLLFPDLCRADYTHTPKTEHATYAYSVLLASAVASGMNVKPNHSPWGRWKIGVAAATLLT